MSNVIYSNARAKSMETRLLGKERLLRMIDSAIPQDALKILSETNFGEGVEVKDVFDFEKLLSVEQENLFTFIRESSPCDYFKEYFLCKNDFHNAEALIRAKYLKIDAENMLVSDGVYSKKLLKDKIFTDDYKIFCKELRYALEFSDNAFVSGRATGVGINTTFVKSMYDYLFRLSEKDKVLKTLCKIRADFANVAIALRTRNYAVAKELFVKTGDVTQSELKLLCEELPEILKEKTISFSNGQIILKAVDAFINKKPFSEFEKLADSIALEILKKHKYDIGGIIPFMLYCYYKTAEIENVRIILVGLINNIDKQEIKNRLRETYEG
ncbi:MAG: V-type ATPase subunit [Clostridia bacterium]|nr:V-type ATPase subunit [Clostridia bacterium]